jgi:hypothetical protein
MPLTQLRIPCVISRPQSMLLGALSITMATNMAFNGRNDGQQVAINHGQVIFNSYTRTGKFKWNHGMDRDQVLTDNRSEQREVPQSPSSTVPFGPDSDFINRGSLLDQVHEKCAAPAGRIALVGVGGVG